MIVVSTLTMVSFLGYGSAFIKLDVDGSVVEIMIPNRKG
jgi:hypothetical protein